MTTDVTRARELAERATFLASGQDDAHSLTLTDCAEALSTLAADLERAREDARRYEWLRDEAHDWEDAKIINLYAGPDFERASGDELDAIIDIEMAPKSYVLAAIAKEEGR